ncbi:aldose 1-epimerase family protein [uncultured Enorma sp.]|uniref:aldose 1-epimerase family protein n=1 Tax=uncultured Enorma sp. TaxID=1714346 RepID=UPI00265FCE36|nr:aldose 1-epimerase family protein [uncultured Enorma sp.]
MSQVMTITNGHVTVTIDSMGAQLTSLALAGNEYLWQGDPRWWAKRAPILFPIVGSLRGGHAASAQGEISLGRHGFARDVEHDVVAQDESSVTFEIRDTPQTREKFPYAFRLNMTYALTGETSLTQTFRVENTDDVTLPFSVGGHPAFNVPAPGTANERFADYEIAFTEPWTCEAPKIAECGLLTYDTAALAVDHSDAMPLTHELFADDAVMLTDVPGGTLTLRSRVSGHGVRIDFADFKYIGIWSALGDAPFVALEPWTGHATLTSEDDVFEHKRDITLLEPGAVDERSFTVSLL